MINPPGAPGAALPRLRAEPRQGGWPGDDAAPAAERGRRALGCGVARRCSYGGLCTRELGGKWQLSLGKMGRKWELLAMKDMKIEAKMKDLA